MQAMLHGYTYYVTPGYYRILLEVIKAPDTILKVLRDNDKDMEDVSFQAAFVQHRNAIILDNDGYISIEIVNL